MSGPLRIALVAACPFPSPQGSQVFVGQMAERLAERGHQVHLLTYGQGHQVFGKGYRHHRSARLPGDDAARSGPAPLKPVLDLMLTSALVRLCRRERIDVVHAHNYEAAVAALAARALTSVPVVYHSHNLMGDELETYFDGAVARRVAALVGGALDRTVPRRADHVIALCDYSAALLRRAGCAPGRLSVIPPAVDDDGPQPPASAQPGLRRQFGLGDDDFVVGYCGNLDAYQNLDLLYLAFARACAQLCGQGSARASAPGPGKGPGTPQLSLLLASHRLEPRLLAHASGLVGGYRLSAVEVHGYAEARAALGACDLVALPRRLGSGYPIKLLNSMSAAKAVVAAGCGSKVLRDGVDGFVVRDDDPAAMAAAILACAARADRGAGLGRAARETFLATATWQVVLPRIEEVYRSVLGGVRV